MMSKNQKYVFLLAMKVLLVAATSSMAAPDRLNVVIRIGQDGSMSSVHGSFSGTTEPDQTNLSFVDNYADATSLAKRVINATVADVNGKPLPLKRFSAGEFVSGKPFYRFKFDFDLSVPGSAITAPHISWILPRGIRPESPRALLKLQDLLPDLYAKSFRIKFELPEGWSIYSSEKSIGKHEFEVQSLEKAVFLTARNVRTDSRRISGTGIEVAILDEWQFRDRKIGNMAVEILSEYRRLFGGIPADRIQINLLQFPSRIGNDRWRAQTQGNTITIVSSPSTYINLASQRLHEQLRHELFHLWIPEAVELEGDYAWFYEGFAQYQSLKAGVWIGRLRFEDYLISMSQAINIASFDRSQLSLPDLSRTRWLDDPGIVSSRGMVVAFLCDLTLLANTNKKRNVGDVIQEVFRKHAKPRLAADALVSLKAALGKFRSLEGIVENHIDANEKADWGTVLKPFGIKAITRGARVTLELNENPSGKQQALLKKLGYNRWKVLPRPR